MSLASDIPAIDCDRLDAIEQSPHAFIATLAEQRALVCGYREHLRLLALINNPELTRFAEGVVLEAAHQRERWGSDHDSGKTPADWFWLIGYLAGKGLHAHSAADTHKALHHMVTAAAALANWHGAILGTHDMRPGIGDPTNPITAGGSPLTESAP